MNNLDVFQFVENGVIHQTKSAIERLKKEGTREVLYTTNGHRILLENLISINGLTWA